MINSNQNKSTTLYIPHGGGPMPLMGDQGHLRLVDFLKKINSTINTPSAIIVLSAHWEESTPVITSGSNPSLIYDYYGFPPETYKIQYPSPGHPKLATKVLNLFTQNNIPAKLDDQRGFDHGHFVPLKLMYPLANIPTIQISLFKGLDPKFHIDMGHALRSLKNENILFLGSGSSFHNLPAFAERNKQEVNQKSNLFHTWLNETCINKSINETERRNRLINWKTSPEGLYCHPREEHLIPLHICYGINNGPAQLTFYEEVIGKKVSAFLW